jgi:hypothetical protein
VQPTLGELSAGGVEWNVITRAEPAAVTHPVTEIIPSAGAERIDPGDGHRGETVLDQS